MVVLGRAGWPEARVRYNGKMSPRRSKRVSDRRSERENSHEITLIFSKRANACGRIQNVQVTESVCPVEGMPTPACPRQGLSWQPRVSARARSGRSFRQQTRSVGKAGRGGERPRGWATGLPSHGGVQLPVISAAPSFPGPQLPITRGEDGCSGPQRGFGEICKLAELCPAQTS